MHIKKLHLINFKNIEAAQMVLSEGINCFVGNNGAGKTNLLDALYYMSFCKSFFNPIDSQSIKHDNDFFVIQGTYELDGNEENIYCGLKKGQKKQFKRNKKEYEKLSSHIGLLPLVMISPQDESLIVEGSDLRRKYIDSVISQYDKNYLDHLISYNKVLAQRNAYLKSTKKLNAEVNAMLDIWDMQMTSLGRKIAHARKVFLSELKDVFHEVYNYISGSKEQVDFEYKSHLQKEDFEDSLKEARQKDIILGYSTKGIHRDDVEFKINDYPIKKIGSQGQKKTFLIALKIGQFKFLVQHKNTKPILMLDDIFDKLDSERGDRLIELVGGEDFMQIFITDTQLNRILPILKRIQKDSMVYAVHNGQFTLYNESLA